MDYGMARVVLADGLAGKARDLIERGDVNAAEALVGRALGASDASASAFYASGLLARARGRAAQAREAFTRAHDLAPADRKIEEALAGR
jgi:Flp pilus assembly protein TadD